MSTLSCVSWITLSTFIMKEQNPDLFSYKTFSTVTLSFLTRPGEVSHQASWWSLSLSLQVFPSTWPSPSHSLLFPCLCPFPCTFLFNRVLDHSVHCFFSFHCDAVLGQTSRYEVLSFLATSVKSALRILYPLQQGRQIYSLLSSCAEQPVTWSFPVPYPPRSNSPGSSLHPWKHLHDLLEARCYQSLCLTFFSVQASSTLPQLFKFITPDIPGPWTSFCKCCPAMCWWLLVWSGESPSEIHSMWTRLKAPGIRYFKIYLVLIFTFFSHYHIPNKYIPWNSEICLLTNSLQIQISVIVHIFSRGSQQPLAIPQVREFSFLNILL